jgi:hypothetical protein
MLPDLHIPGFILAFLLAPALWAKAVWGSPYLKTYRRGLSGLLSAMTGLLLVVAFQGHDPGFRVWFIAALVSMAAMLIALLWPPSSARSEK